MSKVDYFRNVEILEEIEVYVQRHRGLLEEIGTIEVKWRNLSRFIMDNRILPPTPSFKEAHYFLGKAAEYLKSINELANNEIHREKNTIRIESALYKTHNALEFVSRNLAYVKTAYHQRTDSLEIPYVIAGLPKTPERMSCGELFAMASDNLVKNYINQVNLHRQLWDCYVSFYPLHPEFQESPGAVFITGRRVFHITLSEDMKHFVPGLLALAHEVGHATCLSRWQKLGLYQRVPLIFQVFMDRLYVARNEVHSEMKAVLGRERCDYCDYSDFLAQINKKRSRDEFISFGTSDDSSLTPLLNEILPDTIALVIAGPNYLRALFDYIFDATICTPLAQFSSREDLLQPNFLGLITRISACVEYARKRQIDAEWKNSCTNLLSEIESKTRNMFQKLQRDMAANCELCWKCSKKFGEMVGKILAEEHDDVFGDTFRQNCQFKIRQDIIQRLGQRELIVDEEPRAIIHAFFELYKRNRNVDYSVLLYSLANNNHPSSKYNAFENDRNPYNVSIGWLGVRPE